MNRRIKKKKQKLEAMYASKWKYAKLGRKRAHTVGIETRHCMWGMIPNEDNYARYLKRRRRCRKIKSTEQFASALQMLCLMENERKVVKEKLFMNEGEYNPERKQLSDEFVPWRMTCDG